ncbi:MAG: lysylphosphatidylglycerol synthase transmembrane domain-containing protein [bacterium]
MKHRGTNPIVLRNWWKINKRLQQIVSMGKKWLKYLKIIFGLGLLAFIILQVDLKSFVNSINKANYLYVFIGFLFFVFHRSIVDAYRFYYLVKKYFSSFWEILKIFYIGIFFNNILVGGVSAEIYKLYYTNQKVKNMGQTASYIFVEKATLLLVTLVIMLLYMLISFDELSRLITKNGQNISLDQDKSMYYLVGFGITVLAVILMFIFKKQLVKIIIKIKASFHHFVNTLHTLPKKYYIVSFITAFLSYLLKTCAFYFFLEGFNETLSFLDLLFIISSMRFLAYIPMGMGNIGIMEGYIVGALGLFGVNIAEGLAVAVIARVINYLFAIAGAIVFSFSKSHIKDLRSKYETDHAC